MKFLLPLFCLLLTGFGSAKAQSFLHKKVTIKVSQVPLAEVLKQAEQQAGFFFSYSGSVVNPDSLVSIQHINQSVELLLNCLLGTGYQFRESGRYIIIAQGSQQEGWYISGVVTDVVTGLPISNATIFEPLQLAATMTDEHGHFRLKLKEYQPDIKINATKISYADTFMVTPAATHSPLTFNMTPVSYPIDTIVIGGGRVEETWMGRLLLSSRQRMNSLNLSNFFTRQPLQFSLTPGLGSRGRMGSQLIDKFSFNMIGGYTGGIEGLEVGTIFNIVRRDMRYVQVGGIFNAVGGSVTGVQAGGVYNRVLGSVKGVQVAGLGNMTSGSIAGIQVGGLLNTAKKVQGIQVGGVSNINSGTVKGIQVSGLYNQAQATNGIQVSGLVNNNRHAFSGVQVAGLLNIADTFNGLQVALFNICDTSVGYSIGLVNIVRHGYHRLSLSANDMQWINLSYRSGNKHLYSIITAGATPGTQKSYSGGYGLGTELFSGRNFQFNPEWIQHWVYAGSLENALNVSRISLNMNINIAKKIHLFAGPVFSLKIGKDQAIEGYRSDFSRGLPSVRFSQTVTGWVGWQWGISLF